MKISPDKMKTKPTWSQKKVHECLKLILPLLIFCFIFFGFYSYSPGQRSLLNEVTGWALILFWAYILVLVLNKSRSTSSSASPNAGDIRENPLEGIKAFAMAMLMFFVACGFIYTGLSAFWSTKVKYWPGGRRIGASLYVFWSDSLVLAFATSLTWLIIGVCAVFAVYRGFLVTGGLPKWGQLFFHKPWKIK
jgi:hypothetical protein